MKVRMNVTKKVAGKRVLVGTEIEVDGELGNSLVSRGVADVVEHDPISEDAKAAVIQKRKKAKAVGAGAAQKEVTGGGAE